MLLTLALGIAAAQTTKIAKTNVEIRQEIIKQSSCPCPYSADGTGRMCGWWSAYDKPGGASPLCFQKDVTTKMVIDYRKRTR
ncbi:MAG: hypothetical protein DMG16_27020 [Acidobacteria bacterium]|nr:MAG: hypothetical protein DMG16_27020 [Acidobacteriota bacterium]